MLKLIFLQLLHGIKFLRDWNVISVDRSWTLRHVLENVADGTDDRYERDLWTLDTALRGLPLVCKAGLSLTVDNALEFGKYCREAEKGVAWLSLVQCEMLDYACTAHLTSPITPQVERKKKVMLRKPQKCMCISNALSFLFPSLRGPPEV